MFSEKLNNTQKNYLVSEKELLAVIVVLSYFKNSVYNFKIVIYTDHSNLKFLQTSKLQRI
ncbi:hypothetical protein A0H76_2888 [Hepatospora eriocheir]|uniref:Reverse transcriptase RNase H-like domain-containing protein n=1 Tax=Hepatospora eriocheir TaxID=1081669 RepID=A0A1X0Q5P5_9MICR|nr:hypothetical protein A0H76_2888 [Hepatospora eriocheir]